ncbi:MAG: cytochrome c peroxidase [Myxococcota bacterium]
MRSFVFPIVMLAACDAPSNDLDEPRERNGSDVDGDDSDDPDLADPKTGDPVDDYPAAVTDVLDLPSPAYDYSVTWPAHFSAQVVAAFDNTPADNPTTDLGVTLGRVLFYDVNLSSNRTVACASCHLQSEGFSDPNAFSEGFEGGLTGRNSMGLANSMLYDNEAAFWDERAESFEVQVLLPIQDAVEMGLTLGELVDRVEALEYYPRLFADAFGDDAVTTDRISRALAQFVRSIVSYSTPFDQGFAQTGDVDDDFPNLTAEENLGKRLFFSRRGNCAICHAANQGGGRNNDAIFFMDQARNNGLDATTTDPGLGEVTGNPQDHGKFKSPSLRNIALTGPYMHDGRLETLAEVIEHYDNGVQDHPNLDGRLRDGGEPQRLNLTNNEKAALVAFLETLTDDSLLVDPRFSDPFRD